MIAWVNRRPAGMTVIQYALFALFPIGMAYAAVSDLLTMTISNRLILGLLAAFVLVIPFSGMDLNALGLHLATGGVVLAVAFVFFALGWIGGGDAKLAAVAALWIGWEGGLAFIAYASIIGGVLTVLLLAFRARMLPAFALRQEWVTRLHDPKVGVPYGVALAAAALIVYPHTSWLQLGAV
jgi:prepilin peptidase CpaA